ncbi:MAG: fasciclin domain-containing protein [Schleiferiaceae bacterium]|nr:fasciclin domain-containing protein [Schleiferiaceae bacterium]
MMFKNLKFAALAAGLMVFGTACSDDDDTTTPPVTPGLGNIVEVAQGDERFSTLVSVVTHPDVATPDLLNLLGGANNSLTLFAPTNDAFGALLTALGLADVDALVGALGGDAVRNILAYHVLGAKVESSAVTSGYITTLGQAHGNNLSAYVDVSGTNVTLNGNSPVSAVDIQASNGVIHAIDQVLLPLTILELAALNSDFTSLAAAAGVADGNIDDLLGDPEAGPLTLFAPTNTAFTNLINDLGAGDLNGVVSAVGTDGLATVLLYHAVAGANITAAAVTAGTVTTASGQDFAINVNGGVSITDTQNGTANVIATDVQGTNGIIHVIDAVLLPVL